MSDIPKDAHAVWNRLFDHRAFLNGEINFTLREFEQKRNDKEVEALFSLLEKITDIKDNQIERLKVSVNNNLPQSQNNAEEALKLCANIFETEQKFKENNKLETARNTRKEIWQKFVDDMSHSCSRIDNAFEEKEEELQLFYSDLERKLNLT